MLIWLGINGPTAIFLPWGHGDLNREDWAMMLTLLAPGWSDLLFIEQVLNCLLIEVFHPTMGHTILV